MKKIIFLLFVTAANFSLLSAQTTDVVTGINDVVRILLDGNNLYYSDDNSVRRVDITESAPTPELVIDGLISPAGLAVNGNDLYVAEFSAGRISVIDMSSETPTREDFVTGLNTPNFLLLDGNFLYYSDNNDNVVARFDITAATPTAELIATSNVNFSPLGMSIQGNILYMAQGLSNRVSKVDVTSGIIQPEDVVTSVNRPIGIQVRDNILYVSEFLDDKISFKDLSTSGPLTIDLVTGLLGPTDIAINDTTIFIIEKDENKISKIENVLGLAENVTENFSVYPNPTTNIINISNLTEDSPYSIYDVTGKVVAKGIVSPLESIDVSALTSGNYMLQLNNTSIKFIKE